MKVVKIHGSRGDSTLLIGERISRMKKYISGGKLIVITDSNVWRCFQKEFPPGEIIKIGTGEAIKTLDTVRYLYEQLVALEADRSSFLIGIGGGIVCDITGFVASTYMRGVEFGFVATTLLSQVDASVGGKNGVNLGGNKNMVGVFNQPRFVICDLNLLKTLPQKEIVCGFAEIVKHAAIADENLFAYLEENYAKALRLDEAVIEKLVYDSVTIKSSLVNRDEKEKGQRRKLNFGHTFGHAIEKVTGVAHGEAVGVGMVLAAAFSVKKGLLTVQENKRLKDLLKRLKLPPRVQFDKKSLMDALGKDKKREGDIINFVLLNGIGHAVVDQISLQELENEIHDENRFHKPI